QRMKALASQSLSGSVTDTERAYINAEFTALDAEILGIETTTTFNGDALIDGTFNENFFVGLGAAGVVNNITADLTTVNVAAVGGDVSTSGTAATAFTNVTARINTIAT
ncbi:flagellin, partial [Kiloniella litopenaei]